jgi:hypothetical protein
MQPSSKPDLQFERDPRRKQELRCRPYADEIYRRVLGAEKIERAERADDYLLDREYAIDVTVTLPNGMVLNGQEKFLSAEYAKYATATVEYEQNQFTHEPGDWYKLACQFYFVGYENGSGFKPWVMLNWPNVVIATNTGIINWRDNRNNNGRARASFKFLRMADFPESCVIAGAFTRQDERDEQMNRRPEVGL